MLNEGGWYKTRHKCYLSHWNVFAAAKDMEVEVWDAQGPNCRKEADEEESHHDDAIRNDLCLLFLEFCDA